MFLECSQVMAMLLPPYTSATLWVKVKGREPRTWSLLPFLSLLAHLDSRKTHFLGRLASSCPLSPLPGENVCVCVCHDVPLPLPRGFHISPVCYTLNLGTSNAGMEVGAWISWFWGVPVGSGRWLRSWVHCLSTEKTYDSQSQDHLCVGKKEDIL